MNIIYWMTENLKMIYSNAREELQQSQDQVFKARPQFR